MRAQRSNLSTKYESKVALRGDFFVALIFGGKSVTVRVDEKSLCGVWIGI